MWRGLSVFAAEAQARNKAKGFGLGDHLAMLTIPAESPITYRRTGWGRGHYTIWGAPAEILRCVTEVVAV